MYFQLVTLILLIVHANGMLRSSTSRHSAYEIEESQPSISSCFYEIPDLPPRSQPGFLPAFPKERDEFAGKNVDALPYNTEIVFKPMAGIYPVQGLMPFAQGNEQVMLQPAPTDRTGTVLAVWIPKHLVRPERSFKVVCMRYPLASAHYRPSGRINILTIKLIYVLLIFSTIPSVVVAEVLSPMKTIHRLGSTMNHL